MLHPSVTLIIKDGQWQKGRWQQLLLVELDHNRERSLTMLAQGVSL
ncbi:MAG: YjbQ family protein [Patescibacteria group bacterium]